MFSNISSRVRGYSFSALAALLFSVAGWQGYKVYDGKNKQIASQEQAIVQLKADKEELKKDIIKKVESDGITGASKAEVKEVQAKVEKAKTLANQYVDTKVSEIKAKYEKLEASTANAERQRTEISLERAKGLWLAFCLQEPQHEHCIETVEQKPTDKVSSLLNTSPYFANGFIFVIEAVS